MVYFLLVFTLFYSFVTNSMLQYHPQVVQMWLEERMRTKETSMCGCVYIWREWTNCFHRTHSVRLLIDSSLSTSLFNRGKGSFLMARLSTNWVSALLFFSLLVTVLCCHLPISKHKSITVRQENSYYYHYFSVSFNLLIFLEIKRTEEEIKGMFAQGWLRDPKRLEQERINNESKEEREGWKWKAEAESTQEIRDEEEVTGKDDSKDELQKMCIETDDASWHSNGNTVWTRTEECCLLTYSLLSSCHSSLPIAFAHWHYHQLSIPINNRQNERRYQ